MSTITYPLPEAVFTPFDPDFRTRALAWASQHDHFTWLDGQNIPYPEGGFPTLLAAGCRRVVAFAPDYLGQLREAHRHSWLFGYLGYDLKNQLEKLHSHLPDPMGFADAHFYEPEVVVCWENDRVRIVADDPAAVFVAIARTPVPPPERPQLTAPLRPSVSRAQYLRTVQQLQKHILDGDIYEINYCFAFLGQAARLCPLSLYRDLQAHSPAPFSVLQRTGDQYLIGASPERFLRKQGQRLLSQPIKGTAPRGRTPSEDARQRHALLHSEKERAENLMIVDLVRNDLARSAEIGSVRVTELFGIHSFAHVHQMISGVEATLRPGLSFADALANAFPMGSMTGAPKIRAMELIEQYEATRRGLYSGAVGYITPNGDFDLSVVIRSVLYHAGSGAVSLSVGSAITFDADPACEYAECLLKARAGRCSLGGHHAL